MVWTIAGIICGCGVILRIISRRRHIWSICATFAPATLVAAGAILGNQQALNAFLGTPNIAILLAYLFVMIGVGFFGPVFCHTVRCDQPRRQVILGYALSTLLGGLALVAFWTWAPLHDQSYPSYHELPDSWQLAVYWAVLAAYITMFNTNAFVLAVQLLRGSTRPDLARQQPALRIACYFVFAGTASAIPAGWLYTASALAADAGYSQVLLDAGDLLMVLSFLSWGGSSAAALIGPPIHARRHSRRLIRDLTPAWRRIRELHPGITLPEIRDRRPTVQVQRMLIELSDGINLLIVPPDTSSETAVDAVAAELLQPTPSASRPALSVLPLPETPGAEEALYLQIARAYNRQLTAASDPASNACPPAPTGSSIAA